MCRNRSAVRHRSMGRASIFAHLGVIDDRVYNVYNATDFGVEARAVVNHVAPRVARPGGLNFSIEVRCLFWGFMAHFIVLCRVELLRSNRSGDQVNHSVITLMAQSAFRPPFKVEDGLPHGIVDVG